MIESLPVLGKKISYNSSKKIMVAIDGSTASKDAFMVINFNDQIN